MAYTRGHKAVMNTHTVGGNSERVRYVGIDQYGNKYYEDFDAVRTFYLIQTLINEDGLNLMTIILCVAPTEIKFLQSGMAG